jgi:hypothetical protein
MKSFLHSLIPFLPLFCQLTILETLNSVLCSNCHLFSLIFVELNSRLSSTQSESYFTSGGLRPIRLGIKPFQTHDQYFFQLNTCGYSPYVTSSLTRWWVRRLKLLLEPLQRSHSRVRVPRDSWPYFTVSDSRLPQTRGPGPRIYIPQALDSLFVTSYDSQGYGGGIATHLHAGI